MIQSAIDTYHFHLDRAAYIRNNRLAALILLGLAVSMVIALLLSSLLWPTYNHSFVPYARWQDALVALLLFIACLALGGAVFVIRFLHALRSGYREGMLTFNGNRSSLAVRDLSAENYGSIFWMLHSAFWCFVVALVGLMPLMLIGWTLHLAPPALAVSTTILAVVLSIGGIIVSLAASCALIIGCVGAISFCRKLGAQQIYQLSNQAVLRVDDDVLTVINPGMPESMVDLKLLLPEDRSQLLALLQERWSHAQPTLDSELKEGIAQALSEARQQFTAVSA